jgi:hypothetical protein
MYPDVPMSMTVVYPGVLISVSMCPYEYKRLAASDCAYRQKQNETRKKSGEKSKNAPLTHSCKHAHTRGLFRSMHTKGTYYSVKRDLLCIHARLFRSMHTRIHTRSLSKRVSLHVHTPWQVPEKEDACF